MNTSIPSGMHFDRNRVHSLLISKMCLVDGDAVQLLALAESNGTELRNCPKYIREWVNRERAARHGEN